MTLITNHQFKNEHFYFPHHKINFLFIGTFNPEFGEKVPYYYGRKTNYFWRIMSIIFQNKINPYDENFFNLLTKYKIGCIDIVDSVSYENKFHNLINGEGYLDDVLFKKKNNIKKIYNTDTIVDLINKNQLRQVYLTNLGGVFKKEQKDELKLIETHCSLVYLSSPSQYNVHRNGLEKVVDNWKKNLIFNES